VSSAHLDTFTADHLPPREQWPEFRFDRPELKFPAQLNCVSELLDRQVAAGHGDRRCLIASDGTTWTYRELQGRANQIANVLVNDFGLRTGNRVLLRAPNSPLLAACWLAVVKAGAVAVGTMPLLRSRELRPIVDKAQITHALCDRGLADDLLPLVTKDSGLAHVCYFNDDGADALERRMARQPLTFANVETAAEDTCLLAFTSGTTGVPKATMHFHRDLVAVCRCWPAHVLRPSADDIFIGSPPLAFTFGLGGLLLFPLSVGASSVLIERTSPDHLVDASAAHRATVPFTSPTSYRAMAGRGAEIGRSSLKRAVSAGEMLPASTRLLWKDATGLELIDGIGTTEMLHMFISADEATQRPGATGKPVPGYTACVLDPTGQPLPIGEVGQLAVKGPTGCRYLSDDRQTNYVQHGWNLTGDAYLVDADGYFHCRGRTDEMIVSSGYNIGPPEVEEVLLQHPAVAECGVVGVADDQRGQIVKAFVVLREGYRPGAEMIQTLQDHVKQTAAPYKYPRAIAFLDALPKTQTGKLQRFKLREHDLPGERA